MNEPAQLRVELVITGSRANRLVTLGLQDCSRKSEHDVHCRRRVSGAPATASAPASDSAHSSTASTCTFEGRAAEAVPAAPVALGAADEDADGFAMVLVPKGVID